MGLLWLRCWQWQAVSWVVVVLPQVQRGLQPPRALGSDQWRGQLQVDWVEELLPQNQRGLQPPRVVGSDWRRWHLQTVWEEEVLPRSQRGLQPPRATGSDQLQWQQQAALTSSVSKLSLLMKNWFLPAAIRPATQDETPSHHFHVLHD